MAPPTPRTVRATLFLAHLLFLLCHADAGAGAHKPDRPTLAPHVHDELARQYPTVPRHQHHRLAFVVSPDLTTVHGPGLHLRLTDHAASASASASAPGSTRAALLAVLRRTLASDAEPRPRLAPRFTPVFSASRSRLLAVHTDRHHLVPLLSRDDDDDDKATAFDHVLVDANAPYLRLVAPHADVVPDMRTPSDADADAPGYHPDAIHPDLDAVSVSAHQQQKQPPRLPCQDDGRFHTVELAVALDSKFCAMYGGSPIVAKAVVQDFVLTANRAYAANTCVRVALVHVDAQCDPATDPYGKMLTEALAECSFECPNIGALLLTRFSKFWQGSRRKVRRDVAFMFSGGKDGTPLAGVAVLGGTCSRANGYGWVEGNDPFVFAHELGHSLGATHSRFGLMRAVVVGAEEMRFSDFSAGEINRYVDRYASYRCVDRLFPRCDKSCPARCVDGLCVLPRQPGQGQVACTPIAQTFRCAVPAQHGGATRLFAQTCPKKLNVVRRTYDSNDLNMFCCATPTATQNARVVPENYRLFTLVTRTEKDGRFRRTLNYIANERDIRNVTLMSARLEECRSTA